MLWRDTESNKLPLSALALWSCGIVPVREQMSREIESGLGGSFYLKYNF
jgi:hypothetical protein